jgi:hypothetical protein
VVIAKSQPVAVAPPATISITLSAEEAKKLRRVCYYNKTVSKKFKTNAAAGNPRKADDINAFMVSLGEGLKGKGIERY